MHGKYRLTEDDAGAGPMFELTRVNGDKHLTLPIYTIIDGHRPSLDH